MNKEKQIEEMAKDLEATHDYEGCEAWHCGGCEYEKYGKEYFCSSIKQAEKMTAKGYRKASEIAREIFEEIENNSYSYGINFVISKETFAELKKKYIGEDTNVTTNTEEGK